MANQMVECVACGHVGEPQIKGNLWITIILLFVFFPAAIAYEIWRRSSDKVCDGCGNSNIQVYRPHQAQSQIQQRPFNNRASRGRKKDSKIGLLLVAFVLLMIVAIVFIKPDSSSVSQAPAVEQKKETYTAPTTTSSYQSNQTSSDSSSTSVSFDECKSRALSVQLSVAGTQYKSAVLVDSDIAYMARICTNDGSVLVTCSAPDQKIITTRSYDCPL